MPIVRVETTPATWPQVTVTSLGGAHDETKRAAMEPADEFAAPMERTGGPVGQPANSCRMMSRWIQHPEGVEGLQAEFVVADPPKPSSYIIK